ncbi:MAG: hypothetical protein WBE74_09845 [Terracidiphilus sp.]
MLPHSALAIDMMKDGDKAKDLAGLRVFVPPLTTSLYRFPSGA